MTEFGLEWSETDARFALWGEAGAVILTAVDRPEGWRPKAGTVHQPAVDGDADYGKCLYVKGPCRVTWIDAARTMVPIAQWERHDFDPGHVQRVLEEWYKEFLHEGQTVLRTVPERAGQPDGAGEGV